MSRQCPTTSFFDVDAGKWLTHATMLAGTGRGRPPIVDLRRGVSAAYYAVFHDLSRHAAEHVLPRRSSEEQAALRRSYGHQALKRACTWVAGQDKPNGTFVDDDGLPWARISVRVTRVVRDEDVRWP